MPQLFEAVRGSGSITGGNSTLTLTEGVDYTLPAGAKEGDHFVRLTSSRHTGQGDGNANQNIRDFQVWIRNPDNLLASFTVERKGTSGTTDFTFELLCWVGPDSMRTTAGFTVIKFGVATFDAADTTITADTLAASEFTDIERVVVYNTASSGDQAARNLGQETLFDTRLFDAGGGDWDVQVRRASFSTQTAEVTWVAVEWGSWWHIQRFVIRSGNTLDGTTPGEWDPATDAQQEQYRYFDFTAQGGTTTGKALEAFENTKHMFWHAQFRNGVGTLTNQGVDDLGETIEVDIEGNRGSDNINTLLIHRRRNADDEDDKIHTIWAHEWKPPSDARVQAPMRVTHTNRYYDGGQTQDDSDTTPADFWFGLDPDAGDTFELRDVDQTSIWGMTTCTDGGTPGTPRGYTDYFPVSETTAIRMQRSVTGQEERQYVQIVEWPEATWSNLDQQSELSQPGSESATMTLPASEQAQLTQPGAGSQSE